uniref:Prolactin receptor n=1 Tax=Romanomermis culicivorax TaxID=13658 RepID=A0A915JXC7_ROMCU
AANLTLKPERCDFFAKANTPGNEKPSTSTPITTDDSINIVEIWAKSRQKLSPQPQDDLDVPETRQEEKIVGPSDLPNQDKKWPTHKKSTLLLTKPDRRWKISVAPSITNCSALIILVPQVAPLKKV